MSTPEYYTSRTTYNVKNVNNTEIVDISVPRPERVARFLVPPVQQAPGALHPIPNPNIGLSDPNLREMNEHLACSLTHSLSLRLGHRQENDQNARIEEIDA